MRTTKTLRLRRSVGISVFSVLLNSSTAIAACFNPLGCEPETESDCIKKVGSAKTEAGAKALIAECRKLPKVTESQCKIQEKLWSGYMKTNNGTEWEYPDRSVKAQCKKQFPTMFSQGLWLSAQYCTENTARIKEALAGTDPETLQSVRLAKVKRENPSLSQLDNESTVEVLKSVYYPDVPASKLAAFLYVDAPPEISVVAKECEKLFADGKRP